MYERNRPAAFVGMQHGDRNGVVAADDDPERAGSQDLADGGLGALAVLDEVVHVARHVAAIHGPIFLAGIARAAGTGDRQIRRRSVRHQAPWLQPKSRRPSRGACHAACGDGPR